jgi:hypothetical protein
LGYIGHSRCRVKQECARETGSIRQERARQIRETRTELIARHQLPDVLDERVPGRFWPLSWGLCGILIGKL